MWGKKNKRIVRLEQEAREASWKIHRYYQDEVMPLRDQIQRFETQIRNLTEPQHSFIINLQSGINHFVTAQREYQEGDWYRFENMTANGFEVVARFQTAEVVSVVRND